MNRLIALVAIIFLAFTGAAFGASTPPPAPVVRAAPPPPPPPAARPSTPPPSASSAPKSSAPVSSSSPSSGSAKSTAPSRPVASAAKPSTGAKPQPAPASKLIPSTPPKQLPKSAIPAGRNYGRDRTFLVGHPTYLDPYVASYYGNPSSPYFYLWLAAVSDGDHHNDPLLPQRAECKGKRDGVAPWLAVVIGVFCLLLGAFVGVAIGSDW